MPIYLVRWGDMRLSLIKARDEEELEAKLDEVGDAGACRYRVYRGPLWFDFDLPFTAHLEEQAGSLGGGEVVVELAKDVEVDGLRPVPADEGGDTAAEMHEAMLRAFFPKARELAARLDEEPLDPDRLTDALKADTAQQLRENAVRERTAARMPGVEGHAMRQLGMTKLPFGRLRRGRSR